MKTPVITSAWAGNPVQVTLSPYLAGMLHVALGTLLEGLQSVKPSDRQAELIDGLGQIQKLVSTARPVPSRETVSQPLQEPHAASPSATPIRGKKTSLAAPAGLGKHVPGSRARSQSATQQASCLQNQDDTPVLLLSGGKTLTLAELLEKGGANA